MPWAVHPPLAPGPSAPTQNTTARSSTVLALASAVPGWVLARTSSRPGGKTAGLVRWVRRAGRKSSRRGWCCERLRRLCRWSWDRGRAMCGEESPAGCRGLGWGIGVGGLRCCRRTLIAWGVGRAVVGPSDCLGGRTTWLSSCSLRRVYVRLIRLIRCRIRSSRLMAIVASSLCLMRDFRLLLMKAGMCWSVAIAFQWGEGMDMMVVAQALHLLEHRFDKDRSLTHFYWVQKLGGHQCLGRLGKHSWGFGSRKTRRKECESRPLSHPKLMVNGRVRM